MLAKLVKESLNKESSGYETIVSTIKYGLVKINDIYRVENYKGMYKKEVPYIEIPKELADEFMEYLVNYRDLEISKREGILGFNNYCNNMFDEEHTELYPDSVL